MDSRQFFDLLVKASKTDEVADALDAFRDEPGVSEVPFGGRANNRGAIEVAADAARSAIERVTNAHDALLELEHFKHNGKPECRSPREAADAWLGVPMKSGLSGLTPKQRQDLALNTVVRLEPGEGWGSRILTVIDRGIGIVPPRMKDTILSLNESNKIQKHYLAGTYGQGGSSTLVFSKFALIASRAFGTDRIGFTLVRYEELPADEYKTGRYVYLVYDGDVLEVDAKKGDMEHGTLIRHFGYGLTNYTSAIGPKSLYGALQRVLFDPVAPIRFENQVAGWNRTIKGARNALNGAVDQGDDAAKGPDLDYSLPMFNLSLGDLGDIGIEYWVLSRPPAKYGKRSATKPSRSFVDDTKPIILTHNGQNQDELSGRIIRKDADLPFLQAQGRLVVHVNCDRLTPGAKRLLFSSTREKSREGFVLNSIQEEVVDVLKSDDELRRLNEKAREESLKDEDEAAEKQMQKQVAKLLRIVGPAFVDIGGTAKSDDGSGGQSKKRGPRRKPEPIQPSEPPTYIKILGDKDDEITFYGGQRRYLRVETDANSDYHDPDDPKKSRINVAVGDNLKVFGTSPLRGGRMRVGVQCNADVAVGGKGGIRVELYRPGLPTLSDEIGYAIVEKPKPKDDDRQTAFPQIKITPVEGPDADNWDLVTNESEDSSAAKHASGTEMTGGVLYIYYSTVFPRFVSELRQIEQQSPALVKSFIKRYELWLVVHALLVHDDERQASDDATEEAIAKDLARQERCRLASISAMVAAQEVKSGVNTEDAEDAA
jgi:hypothetical protein